MVNRFQFVDMLKGWAIIAVVLLHTQFDFIHTNLFPLDVILGDGWHVAVFFGIAGFFY